MTMYYSLIILSISLGHAQDSTSYQFLFSGKNTTQSGFGSFLISVGSLNGELSTLIGGGGGALINQRFFYGGYGMGLAGKIETEAISGEALAYQFKHGGIWLGYNFMPEKLVHFSVGIKAGWGRIRQSLLETPAEPSSLEFTDKIQVLMPEIMVQINLLEWFRLDIGASYQGVLGIQPNDFYDDSDFNQFLGNVNLSFGWFTE